MAGNVSIETDAADNWKPSKKRSPERIDGNVALVMGLDRASREDNRSFCIYNYRGPVVI
jgi:phage terminase large subunit-like protein